MPGNTPFVLTVVPAEEPVEGRMAIPGERVVFLVTVDDLVPGDGELTMTVEGEGVAVGEDSVVVPEAGKVAEIEVTVDPSGTEAASVTVSVVHGAPNYFEWVERRTIGVMPWQDDRAAAVLPYLDRWVTWLSENHPELGIDAQTSWDATFVMPVLIVSHYAFWSEEWEMVVSWHIMIPPDDFTEIRLRRRFDEAGYSLGFRQDSYQNETEPHAMDPGDLMR